MVSGSEMKALKTVEKENGETTTRLVSRQLGIDTPYAKRLCMNLTRSDYLNQENHGRFTITLKGKKALGWGLDDSSLQADTELPPKNIQREEFQWRSFSATGRGRQPIENPFLKPGQEDVGWNVITYGNSATRFGRGNRTGQASLINEKTHSCGFCGGTGKKGKGAKCPVCRGSGQVTVSPPAVPCAYCRGKGLERRTGRLCTVCCGKGIVSVHLPIAPCSSCQGSGAEQGTGLTCLKCRGKGVVHVGEIPRTGNNGGNGGRN